MCDLIYAYCTLLAIMRTIELAIIITFGFTTDIEKNYRNAKSEERKIVAYIQALLLIFVWKSQHICLICKMVHNLLLYLCQVLKLFVNIAIILMLNYSIYLSIYINIYFLFYVQKKIWAALHFRFHTLHTHIFIFIYI